MKSVIFNTRQKLITLLEYGLYQQAERTLESLILSEQTISQSHWTDYYKYCVLLERTGRFIALLSLVNAFHNPPIYPEPTAEHFKSLKFVLFESIRMRALKGNGLIEYSNKVAKGLLANLPAPDDILAEDHSHLPTGYYPGYDPSVLRSAASAHLAMNSREEGKLPEWRQNMEMACQLDRFVFFDPRDSSHLGEAYREIQSLFEGERYFEALIAIKTLERKSCICPREILEIKAACQGESQELADLHLLSIDVGKDYPNSAVAFYVKGLHLLLRGEREAAHKQFMLATDADRFHTPAWLALGNSYSAMGDHEQAQGCYARIVRQVDDQCIPALVAMASEYLRVNKPLLASPYLSMAIALDSHHPDVLNELGVMFYVRGDLDLALDAFSKALARLDDRWNPRRITIEKNIMSVQVKTLVEGRKLADLNTLFRSWLSKDHLDANASLLRLASFLIKDLESILRSQVIHIVSRKTPSNRFRPLLLNTLREKLDNQE